MLVEREVAVDDAHLVLVAIEDGGKDLGVHLGAEGALEVVEADDQHRGVLRAAARGTASGRRLVLGSWLMSNLLNCASVLPSVESRKGSGWLMLPSALKVTTIWS